MNDPDLILADEPTASLDAHEVQMLFGVLKNLRARGIGVDTDAFDQAMTRQREMARAAGSSTTCGTS